MNLQNFKLLKEDGESYHVSHPNGRKLQILKSGMNDKAHAVIKKLKFAEGGEVDDSQQDPSQPPVVVNVNTNRDPASAPEIQKNVDAAGNAIQPNTNLAQENKLKEKDIEQQQVIDAQANALKTAQRVAPNAMGVPAAPPVVPPPVEQAAPPANATTPIVDPLIQKAQSTDSLLTNEQNLNTKIAAQDAAEKQSVANAYNNYNKALSGMQTQKQILDSFKAKDDELLKNFTSKEVDPERFMHSKSTAGRIGSAIAIMLGGIGAAFTGGPNLALQNIQKQVDADIDAQKNEQGKAMTLWKMNHEALGNELSANLATQNQMWTGVQAKIAQAAAQSAAPVAKLRAEQLNNEIEQKKIMNRQQLGMLQMQGQTAQGSGYANAAADYVRGIVQDPKQQEKALEELDKVNGYNSRKENILSLFDQVDKENTLVKTGGGKLRTPPSVSAIGAEFDALAKDREGRVNETVLKDLKSNMPAPGDLPGTVKEKKVNINKLLEEGGTSSLLDSYHIPYRKQQSQETKTMGGIPYKKVPGGWQKVQQ